MMLKKRNQFFNPPTMQGITVQGTPQTFEIPNTQPIEEITVLVSGTVGGTALTLTGVDNILSLVKRIVLSVNDGVQPRSQVDFSGVGLLEYASQVGLNLDRSTLETVRLSKGATVAANMGFRIGYRIPIVHPMVTEPLRTRMLLPCHTWAQAPQLRLEFANAAEMYSAGALTGLTVEVIVKYRVMPADLTKSIIGGGGFIPSDLIETPYTIATGVGGEQRFPIVTPGQYMNAMIRTYLGGATVTRDVIDQVTTVGSESRWRIESGLAVLTEFRMKHLQTENDQSRVANVLSQTSSPNFSGAVAANTSWQPAASVLLDFMTDGLDSADELGSLLDCNIAPQAGLKMELVGNVANVATNGSTIYIGGHRLFGDLKKWQAVR